MFTFSVLDTYKISHSKKSEKFNVDYKVLVRLYEPIIGSVAMSLYLTLESEFSLNKYSKTTHQIARLHKLTQIDDNAFNNAVELLKKYGLISYKANQRKANDYLFVVYPTLPAVEFFASQKLSNALQVVVDETYYNQVYNYFISNVVNEDEYVDIEDIKIAKNMTEEEFYEQFNEKYPIIASSCAFTNTIKKEINRLKNLFKLSYENIENAILNSFDYESNQLIISLSKLNEYITNKYGKIELNSDELLAKSFEAERSITYFQKMAGRKALLPSETNMINELSDQYRISEGVLNVVINFYFIYGKNKLGVSKNYFVKVIEEMLMNNVSTTIDAMNYFRNRNKKIKEYTERTVKVNKPSIETEVIEENTSSDSVDFDLLEEFKKALGG